MKLAPPTITPPASFASMPLGAIAYDATLTHERLYETDDADSSWGQEDIELWRSSGTSTLATSGVLGAREGYATLDEAIRALGDLTSDLESEIDPEAAISSTGPDALASNDAAAVLEHGGRFFGYRLERSFAATEGFYFEPQIEDNALYDGVRYDVSLVRPTDTPAELCAIVDGRTSVTLLEHRS